MWIVDDRSNGRQETEALRAQLGTVRLTLLALLEIHPVARELSFAQFHR